MTATTKQKNVNGSSQQIVATTIEALLEQQNHSTVVLSTGFGQNQRVSFLETVTGRRLSNQLTSSLMPRKVKLNEKLTLKFVEGLQKAAKNAKAESEKPRARPDIPTADLVRRSGFKTGAKLLIKVTPGGTSGPFEYGDDDIIIDNFSLQGIAEPDEERYQLHETFESEVLFLFGRRPRVWTIQGMILNGKRRPDTTGEDLQGLTIQEIAERERELNSLNMDFANQMIQKWETYLRGSKAIESRSKTYISYEDQIIEGTLLSMTMVRNAQMPSALYSTITFVVHQRTLLGAESQEQVQNLQELVEGAQQNLAKVPPSDLKEAKADKKEAARRESDARNDEKTQREKTEKLDEERQKIEKHLEQRQKDLQKNLADQEVEQAKIDVYISLSEALIPTATEEDLQRAVKAQSQIRKLKKEEQEIRSEINRLEGLQSSNLKELSEANQILEDATQKTQVASATTDATK